MQQPLIKLAAYAAIVLGICAGSIWFMPSQNWMFLTAFIGLGACGVMLLAVTVGALTSPEIPDCDYCNCRIVGGYVQLATGEWYHHNCFLFLRDAEQWEAAEHSIDYGEFADDDEADPYSQEAFTTWLNRNGYEDPRS